MSKQIKTLPKTQPQRNHISHSLLRLLVSYNPAQEEGSATKKASFSSPWNPVSSTHSSCFFVFGSALTPVYMMLIHWFKIRLCETRQNLLLRFEIHLFQLRLTEAGGRLGRTPAVRSQCSICHHLPSKCKPLLPSRNRCSGLYVSLAVTTHTTTFAKNSRIVFPPSHQVPSFPN